jgi:hypothetical protein
MDDNAPTKGLRRTDERSNPCAANSQPLKNLPAGNGRCLRHARSGAGPLNPLYFRGRPRKGTQLYNVFRKVRVRRDDS